MADYTSECLGTFEATESDLRQSHCFRCLRPECEKSSLNTSRFQDRIENWETRLFKSPPRMAPTDPRFLPIAGQRFELAAGGWGGQRGSRAFAQVPVALEAPGSSSRQAPLVLANTAPRSPMMLPGAPAPVQKADPWASAAAPAVAPGERVVVPGSKIRPTGV